MLATPIVLEPATVTVRKEALVSDKAEIGDIDDALERAKEQVGIFKLRHGDAMWKDRVAHIDRKVHFNGATTTPVSRAYFKLMEIIRTCAIRVSQRSLHLCEAPGGFAQATMDDTNAREILVTSRRCSGAPHFSPLILHSKRIDIMKDLPHSADLTMQAVRDEIVRMAQGSELITADGAIDNDAQPEIAEAMTATLICHEVDTALRAQAVGGTFVLKIFSMALPITKECIAILTRCYETVSILKPFTSRVVNDERYIVCQKFRGPISLPAIPDRTPYVSSIADVDPAWMKQMDEIIHGLRVKQREAIRSALTCTLPSASALHRTSRPRRPGQKGGRGGPYPPRGQGRSSIPP